MGKVSMTDKMRMQTLHEQGLWAKALIAACPDKQWKLSRPTINKYAATLMKGDQLWNVVSQRKVEISPHSNKINGLSRKGSYVGEIPQSATIAKNDKRIEGRIEVDVGRFTSGTHEQRHQHFTKWLRTCVGSGGGHIELKLWNNTQVCLITIIWEMT